MLKQEYIEAANPRASKAAMHSVVAQLQGSLDTPHAVLDTFGKQRCLVFLYKHVTASLASHEATCASLHATVSAAESLHAKKERYTPHSSAMKLALQGI